MQHSQLFCLFNERFALLLRELSPSLAEVLGDACMVQVRAVGDQLLPLYLTPDHEGVERSLDMLRLRGSPLLQMF